MSAARTGRRQPDRTRRRLLQLVGRGLLGAAGAGGADAALRLANAAARQSAPIGDDDFRALVCVFLHGGNDSFNMLVPATADEYERYRRTRGDLALPLTGARAALPLSTETVGGRAFAIHPSMPEMRDLYRASDLAFVANVGALVEPTTLRQYEKRSVELPQALFSHNDQRTHWQTARPQTVSSTGWLGRAGDALSDAVAEGGVPSHYSLSGTNLLQRGDTSSPYAISRSGSVRMENDRTRELLAGGSAPDGNEAFAHDNLLARVFADSTVRSIELDRHFAAAFGAVSLSTPFTDGNSLAGTLRAVARTIGARRALGQRRQTFFVVQSGYDTHRDLREFHHALLRELSVALADFHAATRELGVTDQVTTFTASEFGRTLRSNGSGTDHGWGGNAMVLGGAVNGGRILGEYPEALSLGDGLDVGANGRLLPTTSCDEYFFELLRWYGVPSGDMPLALPNLDHFLDPRRAGSDPLGLFDA